jgi:hypothetical protein
VAGRYCHVLGVCPRRPRLDPAAFPTKPFLNCQETISAGGAMTPKRMPASFTDTDQQRSSIMWTVLSLIYRQYCWARLMEMRKSHLSTAH